MPLATNSTPGSIVLAGDLTGTATAPQLRNTGVVPGEYVAADMVIDAKGRVVYAVSKLDVLPEATTTVAGIATIGDGFNVVSGLVSSNVSGEELGVASSANQFNITIDAGAVDVTANVARTNAPNVFVRFQSDGSPVVSTPTVTPGSSLGDSIVCTNPDGCLVNDPTGGDRVITITHTGVPVLYASELASHPGNGTANSFLPAVYGAGRYVMLLQGVSTSTGYTSTDGTTWSPFDLGSSAAWTQLAWNGSIFCAIGTESSSPVTLTSSDGVVWTQRNPGTGPSTALTARGSLFAGFNNDLIYTSTTVNSWTSYAAPTRPVGSVVTLSANDDVFILVYTRTVPTTTRNESLVYTSPTGEVWTQRTPPTVNGFTGAYGRVLGVGSMLYAGWNGTPTTGGSQLVSSSDNGATWVDLGRAGPSNIGYYNGGVVYTTTSQVYVLTQNDGWQEIVSQLPPADGANQPSQVSLGGPVSVITYANVSDPFNVLRYYGVGQDATPPPLSFSPGYEFSNTAPSNRLKPWTVECIYVNGDQLCTYI